jgi:hypothetical protein
MLKIKMIYEQACKTTDFRTCCHKPRHLVHQVVKIVYTYMLYIYIRYSLHTLIFCNNYLMWLRK